MSSMSVKQKAKKITPKSKELRDKVSGAIRMLSDIVGTTLGPGGNPVLIERVGSTPLVTKDGVTVAESVSFDDATQYVIAESAKEVCQKTNREAGDGTTTAIVLAHAITELGIEYLTSHASKSPQGLCRELDKVIDDVTDKIQKLSKPVKSLEEITNVALISSNSDMDVAEAVVRAVDMVGDDGTIITEDGSNKTMVEEKVGFPWKKGLNSLGVAQEIFINDEENQECNYLNPYLVLYDGDIKHIQELIHVLDKMLTIMKSQQEIRPIMIVAHKFTNDVVKFISRNVQAGMLQCCLLETYSTGQASSKHHLLHDLAAFTGAKVFDPLENTLAKSSVFNQKIKDKQDVEMGGPSLDDFGFISEAHIKRYESVFIGPGEDVQEEINNRIEVLKKQMKTESEWDTEITKERISRLIGGVAVIYVGGSSELEIREKKHRIEDAINATKSAIEMGIVPGGGATALAIAKMIDDRISKGEYPDSARILSGALSTPFCRIMANAGENEATVTQAVGYVIKSIKKGLPTVTYDSLLHDYCDPIKSGIIDPVKVVISSIKNAYSVAKMLMTIGGTIVIPRDREEERQAELAAQNLAQQMQGV